MASMIAQSLMTYECAHCKQLSQGEPAEVLLVNNQSFNMCCLGCACAAELLIDLRACKNNASAILES